MAGARAGVRVWLSINDTWAYPHRQSNKASSDSDQPSKILQSLKYECTRKTVGGLWKTLMADRARTCSNGREMAQLLAQS